MSDCTHDCSTCGESCSERSAESFRKALHEGSSVKKVIGVVSGKGGVGKSLVTSLLASEMNKRGHKVAILDADITGPSIPKSFGVDSRLTADADGINPAKSASGLYSPTALKITPATTYPVKIRAGENFV